MRGKKAKQIRKWVKENIANEDNRKVAYKKFKREYKKLNWKDRSKVFM